MEVYEQEKQLIDYLNVIWKRKWLIIISTILLSISVGIFNFILPHVWEVDSIIQGGKFSIQTQNWEFQEVLVANPIQVTGQINERTYNNLIASDLNMSPREFPELKAEQIKNTNLIRVSLKTQDVEEAKSILRVLFNYLKIDLDKRINVEIKTIDNQKEAKNTLIKQKEIDIKDKENQIALMKLQIKDKENEITTKNNGIKKKNNSIQLKQHNIHLKNLEIKSKEIEKDRVLKEIESNQNKLIISEDRIKNIMEEMKAVKSKIDEIEQQLKKALADKKEGGDALSLLLYSNEIQTNLRYYNTLDEKLVNQRITQENLNLAIRDRLEEIKQIDNQISQIESRIDTIKVEINTIEVEINDIETEIDSIKTEIAKIENHIETIKNEKGKIQNTISSIRDEIILLDDKKARIDYAQMIKPPTSSLRPVAPKKIRNVLLAGIIGLIIFTSLAFFLEYIHEQKKV